MTKQKALKKFKRAKAIKRKQNIKANNAHFIKAKKRRPITKPTEPIKGSLK